VTNVSSDIEWAGLAQVEESAREAAMLATYVELAGLPEDDRRGRLAAMAAGEYALSDDLLRPFTRSRMRCWLKMDTDAARRVASSYDAVLSGMPGPIAMRRVALVQTLAKDMTAEEEDALRELVPNVFAGMPRRVEEIVRRAPEAPPKARKPWWAFWSR
jgi:alkanesulfonate monooxygenase SsuD/methylene tetrahydromethanopterin reductase-like flavin-dependent oxidoreductase (luciferase family)